MAARVFVPTPAQVDLEWLTKALTKAGVLVDNHVTEATRKPVGNGLVGDSYRFDLRYAHEDPRAPTSVIGKFPAEDPASRKSGSDHCLYLREVSFYREMASTVAIHTPKVFAAVIDPDTDDFALILEDLAPARQCDQLAGCSLEDAATAMAEAAALHAPRWADPSLETLDWLTTRPQRLTPLVNQHLPTIVDLFKDRYGNQLEPEFVRLVDDLPRALKIMQVDRSTPRTIEHADFRLDNIMFDVQGGAKPMATLDWQTVTLGPGPVDVAYFLSAGIDPAERRLHENDLVALYHRDLVARGVRDYDLARCLHDYRRYSLHGILMGVFSALSVERTARGDALFLKMTRGACAQALDHHSFSFWLD
jgi:hypothetical protein